MSRGEVTRQYHKLNRKGYRVTLPPFARTDGLTEEDYDNGYDRIYKQIVEETGKWILDSF